MIRSTNGGVGTSTTAKTTVSWQDMTAILSDPTKAWGVQSGIHPDLHAIAFALSGNKAFIGSDGGVVRIDVSSPQDQSASCTHRVWNYDSGDPSTPPVPLQAPDLADCQELLNGVPTSISPLNDGLRDLQFQSVSFNPQNPGGDLLGGTQDNGTWSFTGSPSWLETVGGDGGQSGFDAVNGEAALGVRGADGRATLRYARHGGEYELQEAAGPEPGQQDGPRRRLGDNRVQLGGDLLLGGLRFECKAQWQNHSMIEIAREPVGAGTPGIEAEQFHLVLDTYALDLLAHHTAGPLRGTLGVSGLAQTNDTQGPIPVVPDARMHSGAAFAFEELEHGRWSFVAGARVDRRHLETDADAILGLPADSREDLEASADGGVLYRLSDALALNANAGRGWRAPSLFELYANGPHLGEARYELGNPDLEPERSFEAEAGVRVRRPRVKLDLSGFVNRIDRYIEAAPIGETRVVGADTLSVYEYTQADARLTGGALWAEIEAAAPLTLRAQADYVSGQNLALDRPLSWVPPLRAALGVECHRENLGWAERGTLGLEIEHVSEQTRLGPFDTATDPYTLLHLEAGMERRFGSRTFQLDLRVRNLADRTYRSFLSRYKGFAPDPGRNVVLRLSTVL